MAIYQARFMRYLEYRGIVRTEGARCAFSGTVKRTNLNRWVPFQWLLAKLDNLILL